MLEMLQILVDLLVVKKNNASVTNTNENQDGENNDETDALNSIRRSPRRKENNKDNNASVTNTNENQDGENNDETDALNSNRRSIRLRNEHNNNRNRNNKNNNATRQITNKCDMNKKTRVTKHTKTTRNNVINSKELISRLEKQRRDNKKRRTNNQVIPKKGKTKQRGVKPAPTRGKSASAQKKLTKQDNEWTSISSGSFQLAKILCLCVDKKHLPKYTNIIHLFYWFKCRFDAEELDEDTCKKQIEEEYKIKIILHDDESDDDDESEEDDDDESEEDDEDDESDDGETILRIVYQQQDDDKFLLKKKDIKRNFDEDTDVNFESYRDSFLDAMKKLEFLRDNVFVNQYVENRISHIKSENTCASDLHNIFYNKNKKKYIAYFYEKISVDEETLRKSLPDMGKFIVNEISKTKTDKNFELYVVDINKCKIFYFDTTSKDIILNGKTFYASPPNIMPVPQTSQNESFEQFKKFLLDNNLTFDAGTINTRKKHSREDAIYYFTKYPCYIYRRRKI